MKVQHYVITLVSGERFGIFARDRFVTCAGFNAMGLIGAPLICVLEYYRDRHATIRRYS